MTVKAQTMSGFRLDPGEVIGERFRVGQWDATDPDWPAVAVDLLHPSQQVQLAVHAAGPWMPETPVTQLWDAPWPQPSPACLLPRIDCLNLRHGGGVLSASATPISTNALGNTAAEDLGAETVRTDDVTDAPAEARRQLMQLRLLHVHSAVVEELHQSRQAHGTLTALDFRHDDNDQLRLRTAPGWRRPHTTPQRAQAADMASLQRIAFAITGPSLIPPPPEAPGMTPEVPLDSDSHSGDGALTSVLLRTRLRSVLHRHYCNAAKHDAIRQWRLMLELLIWEYETTWLTDEARQSRGEVVDLLIHGDFDQTLYIIESSLDPWCSAMRPRLAQQKAQAQDDYAAWLDRYREEPLLQMSEQLLELLSRGFELPESSQVAPILSRLGNNAHHLRSAAAAIQNNSWRQAHDALSAASSLDPANPTLTALKAVLPGTSTYEAHAS